MAGLVPAIHAVVAGADAGRLGLHHETITAAIQRESNMKHSPRAWKAQLIVNSNPGWLDLFETLNC
jgi:predicted GIY-YIG superfamily endonuclease